jgi:HD-like signal output (HDOD) protein
MQPASSAALSKPVEFDARLNTLFAHIERLPTLPAIFWEITAQLQSPRNSAVDLAEVIENDPSLASNVLRLANSAYYGFSSRFVSIIDAIVAIGRREIEKMVSATLVIDIFCNRGGTRTMNHNDFWTHCVQTAAAAEFISDCHAKSSPFAPVEAYLSGLLHDIGKLVLSEFFTAEWAAIRHCAEAQSCSDADAERAMIGTDHGEIGARLMEAWAAAPNLIEATRYHHSLSVKNSRNHATASLIAMADSICHAYAQGRVPEKPIPHPIFGLDQRQAEQLAKALDKATKRSALLLH